MMQDTKGVWEILVGRHESSRVTIMYGGDINGLI